MPGASSQRARIAALVRSSLYSGSEVTANARQTFKASFEDAVDPERQLPEAERLRRAEALRRAHYVRLAYKSAKARGRKNKKATSAPTSLAAQEVSRASGNLSEAV